MNFINQPTGKTIPDEVLYECSKFAQTLQKYAGFSQLILYGSYAKGTAHSWSDIDLAVVSKDFQRVSFLKRKNLLLKACLEANTPKIQSIGLTLREYETGSRPRILKQIRQGVILFKGQVSRKKSKSSSRKPHRTRRLRRT